MPELLDKVRIGVGRLPSVLPRRGVVIPRLFPEQIHASIGPLLKFVWRDIQSDGCIDMAAQVSFYFVLAMFPFFIFLAALVSYLPITNLWNQFVTWVILYFPRDSRRIVLETVLSLTRGHV